MGVVRHLYVGFIDDGGVLAEVFVLFDPGLLIHRHEDVGFVAFRHHAVDPQPCLIHNLPTLDLSRICAEAVDLQAGDRCDMGEQVAQRDCAFATLSRNADDYGCIRLFHEASPWTLCHDVVSPALTTAVT